MLSSGLTFTRADRELDLRRIGFVAAHGGTCICICATLWRDGSL